jgi:hypothetical protein
MGPVRHLHKLKKQRYRVEIFDVTCRRRRRVLRAIAPDRSQLSETTSHFARPRARVRRGPPRSSAPVGRRRDSRSPSSARSRRSRCPIAAQPTGQGRASQRLRARHASCFASRRRFARPGYLAAAPSPGVSSHALLFAAPHCLPAPRPRRHPRARRPRHVHRRRPAEHHRRAARRLPVEPGSRGRARSSHEDRRRPARAGHRAGRDPVHDRPRPQRQARDRRACR